MMPLPTDIVHVKCVFEDTFSFAKTERVVTRSRITFEKMKEYIGQVVHSGFKNWKLISCEQWDGEPY